MRGLVFLLIGPAGSGKTTLIEELTKGDTKVAFLPTYTTRAIREGETEGKPYYFITREGFEDKILAEELIEWKYVHGDNYYGMGMLDVEREIKSGISVITDIDILGALDVIEWKPELVVTIFVNIESKEELIERIKRRGSCSEEELGRRISRLERELVYKNSFDYYLENNDLKTGVNALKRIISLEQEIHNYRNHSNIIIHYITRLIIINAKGELLMLSRKGPSKAFERWHFIETHILKGETPKDALQRGLVFLFSKISDSLKNKLCSLTQACDRIYNINTHKHYEMTFYLTIDEDIPLESDNYVFKWLNLDVASKYIDSADLKLIDSKVKLS